MDIVSVAKTTADHAIAMLPYDFHLLTDKHEIREAFLPAYNLVANSKIIHQAIFVDYLLSNTKFSRQILSLCATSAGNLPFSRQILLNPKATTEMVETLMLTRVRTLGFEFRDIDLLLNQGKLVEQSTVVAVIASIHASQIEQLFKTYPDFEFYIKEWTLAELAEVYNKVMWVKMSDAGRLGDVRFRTQEWSNFHYWSSVLNKGVPLIDAFVKVAQKLEHNLPDSWVEHLFVSLVDSQYVWKEDS